MVWDITIKDMTLALLDNVLDSRAWAFQESFLAPRTLYFTADQLLWECISMSACETFPGSFNTGAVNIPAIKTRIWDLEKTDPDQKWAMIISDYSGKSVTFPKDQLIAVSGIARLFATKFRTTYLAGMWKENLVPQLAWFALEPSGADTRDSMPSWTWASVNTRVSTSRFIVFQEYFPLVAVLEATTVVVDDDFDDVKEGTIRMRCRLPFIAGIVEELDIQWFSIRLGLYSPAFKLCLYPDRTRYSIGQELYLLPLLRGITPDLDLQLGTRYKLICGLVVEPAQPGSYRRTGYFVILGDTEIEWVLKAQKVASYEDPGFIGEASGSDEEGQKMCIITLK
jgi:hypothetical protein